MQLCLEIAFFKKQLYGSGGVSWFHSQFCHCYGPHGAQAGQLKSCKLQRLGLEGPPRLLSNCNWKQLLQRTAWEIRNSCPQLPKPLGPTHERSDIGKSWWNRTRVSVWLPARPEIIVTHQLIRKQFLPSDQSSRKAWPQSRTGSVQDPSFPPALRCAID